MQGSIPSNLGLMRDLFEVDLSGNRLSGCIPSDMQVSTIPTLLLPTSSCICIRSVQKLLFTKFVQTHKLCLSCKVCKGKFHSAFNLPNKQQKIGLGS